MRRPFCRLIVPQIFQGQVCLGVQVVGCWLWLSNRFEEDDERFPNKRAALAYSEELIDCMSDGLMQMCGPHSLNRVECRPQGRSCFHSRLYFCFSLVATPLPACIFVFVKWDSSSN